MNKTIVAQLLGGLALLCVLLGIVASFLGGALLGQSSFSLQLGALGFAVLAFSVLVALVEPPPPPRPRCPPFCRFWGDVALIVFILAIVAAVALGGYLSQISAGELFVASMTLAVIHIAGRIGPANSGQPA